MTTPVSFELAKLLKEKGFDNICYKWYSVEGGLYCQDEFDNCRGFIPACECGAPTVAEAVMWLYDNHKIWIVVFPTEQDWTFDIFKGLNCVKSESFFNTPVNAYEAAIEYALNNLV